MDDFESLIRQMLAKGEERKAEALRDIARTRDSDRLMGQVLNLARAEHEELILLRVLQGHVPQAAFSRGFTAGKKAVIDILNKLSSLSVDWRDRDTFLDFLAEVNKAQPPTWDNRESPLEA